jgi:hypothetical protein
MKISVIQKADEIDEIIPKISKFANKQTAIKESDFSSNSEYQNTLQDLSRSEWVPTNTGGRATYKWFYERTRGQYLDEKSRRVSAFERKRFDIEYPKKQKFTKTDLAKYEMSWLQKPFEVSKGAEKNYDIFEKEVNKVKVEVNKKYFHRLIAKAILFKEVDAIVIKKNLGGYKANMVAYTVSWLSYKTNKKLNLDHIWENQTINEELYKTIDEMIDLVWQHINNPSKSGMNIGEWCKKQECWLTLKDKSFDISKIDDEITNFSDDDIELTPHETTIINEAIKITPEKLFAIAKWAKENNKLTPFDRKFAFNLGVYLKKNRTFSIKQAKNALRIVDKAISEGFKN